ncbi:MAG: YbgC/FadM family acyl-CoA thioesterase [Deltaproteobacteria bacterium]|jgi:acyl-CoA thioester hydrolase
MLPIRVYYEDTDCAGVVYYASYLRYFERGRVEFFRDLGISVSDYHDKGLIFVVTNVEVEYILPGRYDDLLLLDTRLTDISGVTLTFRHSVTKEGSEKELARGSVVLALVNRDGKPVRIPEELRRVLSRELDKGYYRH